MLLGGRGRSLGFGFSFGLSFWFIFLVELFFLVDFSFEGIVKSGYY